MLTGTGMAYFVYKGIDCTAETPSNAHWATRWTTLRGGDELLDIGCMVEHHDEE